MPPFKPFTKADHQKLRNVLRQLHDLLPIVDDMNGCGIECQQSKLRITELTEQLTEIEKRFMTPTPRR